MHTLCVSGPTGSAVMYSDDVVLVDKTRARLWDPLKQPLIGVYQARRSRNQAQGQTLQTPVETSKAPRDQYRTFPPHLAAHLYHSLRIATTTPHSFDLTLIYVLHDEALHPHLLGIRRGCRRCSDPQDPETRLWRLSRH